MYYGGRQILYQKKNIIKDNNRGSGDWGQYNNNFRGASNSGVYSVWIKFFCVTDFKKDTMDNIDLQTWGGGCSLLELRCNQQNPR